MTNADRIRAMTDEQLAEFLSKYMTCEYGCCASEICDYDNECISPIQFWLQSESEVRHGIV